MIRAARSRFRIAPGEKGFTMIEVLIAGLVMVIGLIFIAQLFTSSAARILTSDTRSLMDQVATQTHLAVPEEGGEDDQEHQRECEGGER